MLPKTEIESNLDQLNQAYSDHPQYGIYFSKLAILELCGWTELCMDQIVRSHALRKSLNSKNSKYLERNVINKTFGFQYEKHFRNMLMRLLGLSDLERLEVLVDTAVHAKMDAQLNNLTAVRNALAHTFVQPAMAQIDAPSVTRARLLDLHAGLAEYDTKLKAL